MASKIRMDRAARIVLAGGVIAYPTEAVYGLGCLPGDAEAVERLLKIKQRPPDKGLILVAANLSQIEPFVRFPDDPVGAEVLASWPGPVTWLLCAQPGMPPWLTGGGQRLAVRISAHPIVAYLCQRIGSALVSTSANRSGHRPARTALHVHRELGAELDYILAGPLGAAARPTLIRDGADGSVVRPA